MKSAIIDNAWWETSYGGSWTTTAVKRRSSQLAGFDLTLSADQLGALDNAKPD
jgi:hypothetical protein